MTDSTFSQSRHPGKKGSAMAKTRKPKEPDNKDDVIVPQDDATRHFVQTLVANGQAARANADGTLPPGVTHEIVGETPGGVPIVRRRRFSTF
jgi:hypothetical protein